VSPQTWVPSDPAYVVEPRRAVAGGLCQSLPVISGRRLPSMWSGCKGRKVRTRNENEDT
jgi:hypothetical protein